MRTTKELLTIVLRNIPRLRYGLCTLILKLGIDNTITFEEYFHLKRYIKENRPFNFRSIMDDPFYWGIGKLGPRRR